MKLLLTLVVSVVLFGVSLQKDGLARNLSSDQAQGLFTRLTSDLERLLPDIKKLENNKLTKVTKVLLINGLSVTGYAEDGSDNNIHVNATFTAPGGKPDYTSEDPVLRQGLIPVTCLVTLHNHGFASDVKDELVAAKC